MRRDCGEGVMEVGELGFGSLCRSLERCDFEWLFNFVEFYL